MMELWQKKDREQALRESAQVKLDLDNAGFIVNNEKCNWEPSCNTEWLGFQIDLSVGKFSVPACKIDMLRSKLLTAKEAQLVPARQLASVIGTIISMSIALGPVTCLMTHKLFAVVNDCVSWCQRLALSKEALDELQYWLDEISHFNGQKIWPTASQSEWCIQMQVPLVMGGYFVEHGNVVANGQWSPDEATQSSTWRELRAVRMVLESFQTKLKNERVHWFTDNQNVVRIVQCGSKKLALQSEVLGIFSACVSNNIRIEPEWIPTEQNELADYYSRIVDYNDWMLNPSIFSWLDALWGPHQGLQY